MRNIYWQFDWLCRNCERLQPLRTGGRADDGVGQLRGGPLQRRRSGGGDVRWQFATVVELRPDVAERRRLFGGRDRLGHIERHRPERVERGDGGGGGDSFFWFFDGVPLFARRIYWFLLGVWFVKSFLMLLIFCLVYHKCLFPVLLVSGPSSI